MNELEKILHQYWKYPKFRPLQEEVIRSITDQKRDTLALLPTGGGKSVLYQVSGLYLEGVCIVITPLIALMKDQVEQLKKRGISAAAIYSGMKPTEIDMVFNHAQHNALKFLYVSPERLSSDMFIANIKKINIGLIAVDEAHCISQWGFDFRPSYLQISTLRYLFPEVNILAVTATATTKVVDDIKKQLGFAHKSNFYKKSFARDNLVYVVRESETKERFLINALKKMQGSAVVYVRSRKKTSEIAMYLNKNGISASFYHAGLDSVEKDQRQQMWTNGQIRVIVATNAFGMGIDKADVRLVVHIDLPDSVEAYFQEAGRAGRDEKRAYALLLYNKNDEITAKKRITMSFPETDFIKRVYEALGNYYQLSVGGGMGYSFNFNLYDFCSNFKMNANQVYSSLRLLQAQNYIDYSEESKNPTRIMFRMSKDDLYRFQVGSFKYDDFVKTLLRTYVGVFSEYININEKLLASKIMTTEAQVKKLLYELSKLGVIHYIPGEVSSYITYTQPRIPEHAVAISKASYFDRKSVIEEKQTSMLAYASTHTKCRSQYLLHYFSDDSARPCGKCDVCQKSKEQNPTNNEFETIQAHIKMYFQSNGVVNEQDLIKYMNSQVPKFKTVFKWLMENDKIKRQGRSYSWR